MARPSILVNVLVLYTVSALVVEGSGADRRLLQSTQGCSVDYSTLDYSPVTSKCKGPDYPAAPCCAAYSSFCAPFKTELNNFSKMCAIMFTSYLNLAGSYPNGVFLGRCNKGDTVCS